MAISLRTWKIIGKVCGGISIICGAISALCPPAALFLVPIGFGFAGICAIIEIGCACTEYVNKRTPPQDLEMGDLQPKPVEPKEEDTHRSTLKGKKDVADVRKKALAALKHAGVTPLPQKLSPSRPKYGTLPSGFVFSLN